MSNQSKEYSRIPPKHSSGVTLVELLVTITVLAIALTLAMPSWLDFKEKRNIRKAAESIMSFVNYAQSAAIKMNEDVNVSWKATGTGHSANFCIGASAAPQNTPCNCWINDVSDANFCSVDGFEQRMFKEDFAPIRSQFMHMRLDDSRSGNFTFDPVRGMVSDVSNQDIFSSSWVFYMHSDDPDRSDSGGSRLYGVELQLNVTGRMAACQQTDRRSRVGGLPDC